MGYTEAGFDQACTHAGTLLGELKWVDDSLAYLNDPWVVSPVTMGEQISTGLTRLTAPLGHTHPFQATGHSVVPIYMKRQAGLVLPTLEANARTWADGWVEAVRHSVRHLKNSVSGSLSDLAWDITNNTLESLGTDIAEDDIGHLGETLGHWRGTAAGAFSREFYTPLGEANRQQQSHLYRLIATIAVQKAILDVAQHSMMNTALGIETLLDAQLRNRQASEMAETKQEIEIAAGVLSIIGDVAGATPAAGAGAAANVIATLLGFAADALPSGDISTLSIAVVDASATAESWLRTMGDIVENNRSHQDDFAARDVADLASDLESATLAPPAPALAGGVTPGTFHHDSAD